jgi:hypothetical protein
VRERPTDGILFVCIAMDISARPYKGQAFIEGTSNPGIITHQWGGVGRCVPLTPVPTVPWRARVGLELPLLTFGDRSIPETSRSA